jgi:hypothetical protein
METQVNAPAQEVVTVNSLEALEALAAKAKAPKAPKTPKAAKSTDETPADGGPTYNVSKPLKLDLANMRPSRNQKELEKVLFPVSLHKVQDIIPTVNIGGNLISLSDAGQLANYMPDQKSVVTRTDEGNAKIISFVGDGYNLVSNQTLLDQIKPIVDAAIGKTGYKVRVSNWKDRRFFIEFIIEADPTRLTDKDLVYTSIKLYNSYDGGQKYSLAMGGVRLVCTNGLTAFEAVMSKVARHTANINVAVSELEQALENNKKLNKRYLQLVERAITPEEVNEVMTIVKESKGNDILFPKKKAELALSIAKAEAESMYGGEMNAWLLYNGFNNVINHNLSWEQRYLQKTDTQMLNLITDRYGIKLSTDTMDN